jgi:hypothetical protein
VWLRRSSLCIGVEVSASIPRGNLPCRFRCPISPLLQQLALPIQWRPNLLKQSLMRWSIRAGLATLVYRRLEVVRLILLPFCVMLLLKLLMQLLAASTILLLLLIERLATLRRFHCTLPTSCVRLKRSLRLLLRLISLRKVRLHLLACLCCIGKASINLPTLC